MKHLAIVLSLAACTSDQAPRNRVVEVLRIVAPGLACTPEPPVGGLDVALCRDQKSALLCTGGGLSPVECESAVKLAAPSQPAPTPEQPTP